MAVEQKMAGCNFSNEKLEVPLRRHMPPCHRREQSFYVPNELEAKLKRVKIIPGIDMLLAAEKLVPNWEVRNRLVIFQFNVAFNCQ